jgi:nucleoside-diphosphate-sugar epimerase
LQIFNVNQYSSFMGSYQDPTMNILITGAGGFIGQRLAAALMIDPTVQSLTLTDVREPKVPSVSKTACRVTAVAADLTQLSVCRSLIEKAFTHVFLLHGIMSGAAEANLELGLKVNVDSMRYLLDQLRQIRPPVRVVFPSSLAVFGPTAEDTVVDESTLPMPQSSYGAQKQMCEILVNDFSRRGLLDGRIVRLPTIIVRPGQPTGAASSFCSGIIREPLNGISSVLPVSKDLKLWVCSTRTVIRNLIVARDVPASAFGSGSRITNLPGITVSVREMLSALEQVGGKKALDLVEEKPDEAIARIVSSWPARFDVSRAETLGYRGDGPLIQTLQEYIEDFAPEAKS